MVCRQYSASAAARKVKLALQFHPDWKTSLLTLLLLPLLVSLGFWQLQREQEKREILARYQARLAESPTTITSLVQQKDLAWRRVTLNGEFAAEHTYLLDNQIRNGRVGFDVLQPLVLSAGQMQVWVNRGWLEGKRLRSDLPEVQTPTGQVKVNGYIYMPSGKAFSLAGSDSALSQSWPRVIQSVSVATLDAGENSEQVFNYIVRLSENSPAALQADWPTISVQPAKHRGYAVQWFCMAFALLLFYLLHSSNLRVRRS